MVWCSIFSKSTGTTEIFTFWHILALHDARRICLFATRIQRDGARGRIEVAQLDGSGQHVERVSGHRLGDGRLQVVAHGPRQGADPLRAGAIAEDRSEEHTSELQSLLRYVYAVICLNQKTNIPLSRPQ